MIYSVNDLEVYKLSLDLLKDLYEFLRKIPFSEYDTVKNAKRAGKSIPTNISEGFAKRSSEATFKNHLKISIGSSDEKYRVLSKRLNKLHSVWRSGKF